MSVDAVQQFDEIWRPNIGPQSDMIECPVFELFFGGARGGGKTAGMLGEWATHAQRYGGDAAGLMVRRDLVQLTDTIEESKKLYGRLGATFQSQDKVWRFPNGARLRFAYLENDSDAESYQGHQYTRIYVEEIGTFPNPEPVMKLMACLRSSAGVPVGFRATGNPGGPGHGWVKARYVDPWPAGYRVVTDAESGLERIFIPSKVADNKALVTADPKYVQRLKASGSKELVRAWLEGDWDLVLGAYFPEWNAGVHRVADRELPAHWARIRGCDWGSAAPFCVLWAAVSDGELPEFPRGALVVYREWYGWDGKPNKGCRMPAQQVGEGIREIEKAAREDMSDEVIDPAAFASDGGPSIAERMDLNWRRADNKRIAVLGRSGGWDQVRQRLRGDGDGRPMLYIMESCVNIIRTLPALQHDPNRMEDVDTEGEDHAADALRYICMSRPLILDKPKDSPRRYETQLTLNELIARQRRKRQAQEG